MHANLALECRDVCHGFGDRGVLSHVSLQIRRGSFVALVGPSGCGKTTLLRAVLGTLKPDRGAVVIYPRADGAGNIVRGPGPDRGIVYQSYSLFPFLTAAENIAFGLKLAERHQLSEWLRPWRWRAQHRRRLDEAQAWLERLKLADAAHLYPHEISGGMRQRVALAQALILKPAVLLLDEPFGAVDETSRGELQRMLLALYQENIRARSANAAEPHTILMVTHDLSEAVYVGDRVVGLSQRREQQGKGPSACPGATVVYDTPMPVFHPDELLDEALIESHCERIRRAVFNTKRKQELSYQDTMIAADVFHGAEM